MTPADFERRYGVNSKTLRSYLRDRWPHEQYTRWDLDTRKIDDALDHFGIAIPTRGTLGSVQPGTEPQPTTKQPSATLSTTVIPARNASKPPGLHHQLLEQARAAGIPLRLGERTTWLTSRGHLADSLQSVVSADLLNVLATIHRRLGGDADLLAAKMSGNRPVPDLIHDELGCVIEVDEVQHFTTARVRTFDLYPGSLRLGFDLANYLQLLTRWKAAGDRAFAHKTAADFPKPGGRQSQRAYNHALRDLLAPTFTGHPVIRIAAPDRSMAGALRQLQRALEHLD